MSDWIQSMKLHVAQQLAAIGQPRHALVSSVDPVSHAVKVTIQPEGIESGWVPDGAVAACGLTVACPAEIGTQVLIVPVEGDPEHPVIVARLFDVDTVPPTSPATNKPVQAGEIGFFTKGGSYLHLTPDGLYVGGNLIVSGELKASGDVVSGSVSLQQHRHGSVQSGTSISGVPETTGG